MITTDEQARQELITAVMMSLQLGMLQESAERIVDRLIVPLLQENALLQTTVDRQNAAMQEASAMVGDLIARVKGISK